LNPFPEAEPKQPFISLDNSGNITLKRFSQKYIWGNRIQVSFDASEEFEPSTFKVIRYSTRRAVGIGMVSFIHGANLTTKPDGLDSYSTQRPQITFASLYAYHLRNSQALFRITANDPPPSDRSSDNLHFDQSSN